jgi:hypothetical protein
VCCGPAAPPPARSRAATDIPTLLARARAHDPEAVEALADLIEAAVVDPERRVGAALGIGRHSGISAERAALIAERDDALRELASVIAPGLPFGEQAASIAQRAMRYRPATIDRGGSAERQALHRLVVTGLPVPGIRHLKRILAKL